MEIRRRDFLSGMAAGGAVLSMPAFLAGCGIQQAKMTAKPAPENPFLQWFGVDQPTVARVMAETARAVGVDIRSLLGGREEAR